MRLSVVAVSAVAACLVGATGIAAHVDLRHTLSDSPTVASEADAGAVSSDPAGDPAGRVASTSATGGSEEVSSAAFPPIVESEPAAAGIASEELIPSEDAPTITAHGPDADAAAEEAAAAAELAGTHDVQRMLVSVDRGDTLLGLLVDAAVPRDQAVRAIEALRSVFNPRKLQVGQEIALLFQQEAEDARFLGLEFEPNVARAVSVALNDTDAYEAVEVEKPVERRILGAESRISSSLFEAGATVGVPIPVMVELIRAFSYDVDFQRDIQPGDTFAIMFERDYTEDGTPVREGDVLYASLVLSGKEMAIYRYTTRDGEADYFTRKGESVRKALLRTPVDGARISSKFGMRRHPILAYSKMHKGVDFAAPSGTPIFSAGNGTIEEAGPKGAYGNYVRVRHNREIATAYAHMSRFAKGMKRGARVRQGDVIGYVGTTGRSTGPHLHYEVLRGGRQVNPLSVDLPTGIVLDGKELVAFERVVEQLDRQFAGLQTERQVAQTVSDPHASAEAPCTGETSC